MNRWLRYAGIAAGKECARVKVWSRALAICLLAVAVIGCGATAEDEAALTPTAATSAPKAVTETQPSPTTEAVAESETTATPTPAPDATSTTVEETVPEEATPVPPTRTQSIIFYDLTEIEKTCPGYQEFTGFRQTVSQVKITCTGPGVETVYFVDLDNLVVTGIRVPLLEQEIP
jgi:hypothetical protein